jgi:hypothetical protein
MPITQLMSEICNLAYLIVENIVEEQYDRHRGSAAENRRRKSTHRPHRSQSAPKNVTRPPEPPRQP